MKKMNVKRIWMAMALLAGLATSGCNGLLVTQLGPKAGELNWAGRALMWPMFDRVGLTGPVNVDGARPTGIENAK